MKKMKNLKRLFAGIMSSAMVMASVCLPATTAKAADTATTDTIDTTKEVTLTIQKYEYTSTGGTEINGTGSSTDVVPSGAIGLNDVEFTVYKIADIEQGTDSGSTGIKYKTLTDLVTAGVATYIEGGMTETEVKATFIDAAAVKAALDARTEGTNKAVKVTATVDSQAGVAKFTNADLDGQGLYLVVETDKPAKVTSEMAPFLVSLPTTIEQTDNSGWLYDVYAYPKNSTQTSAITIKKQGKVADETSPVDITGASFYLQMKVDGKWVTQEKNANGTTIGTDGLITITNAAGFQVSDLAPGEYRFIEVSAPTGYIAESDVSHEFTIDSDGNVLINGTANATMTVINDKPTVEKEVLKKGGSEATADDWSYQADYSTGDTVTYKISVTIPESIEKLSTFEVVDTFADGLFTVDSSSFEYTFYTGEGTSKATTTAMTAPTNTPVVSTTGWTLDLIADKTALNANNITAIEITFDAKLTAEAITAGDGNINNVSLEYTNHTYSDTTSDPENPVTPPTDVTEETTTITDETVVFTFGLSLTKSFVGGTGNEKATFVLYKVDDNGSSTIKVNNSSVKVSEVKTLTDVNGTITIDTTTQDVGLSNGTYYLVETDTAEGYNLLKEPVEVVIEKYYEKTFETTTTVTQYNAAGEVIGTPVTTTTGTETVTYYSDSAKQTVVTGDAVTTSVTVENRKGFNFPVTGGKGTVIFTITGLTLMIVAVCIFFTSKKRKTN